MHDTHHVNKEKKKYRDNLILSLAIQHVENRLVLCETINQNIKNIYKHIRLEYVLLKNEIA